MVRSIPLVVGETPSLGRAIVDLLDSAGVEARYVPDLDFEHALAELREGSCVVIAACNESFCATARRWSRGELPHVRLVVVGSRDPILASLAGVRIVPLPLRAGPFLVLVHELLAPASPTRT